MRRGSDQVIGGGRDDQAGTHKAAAVAEATAVAKTYMCVVNTYVSKLGMRRACVRRSVPSGGHRGTVRRAPRP